MNMGYLKNTIIVKITENTSNNIYMKRDDLIGFSFGGNKVRKALNFQKEIINNKNDIIITYGSSSSNHCRIIANMAKAMNIKCIIVSPLENYKETYNSRLIKLFGAEIVIVPVNEVSKTIDKLIKQYSINNKPYFIPGGGHGNLGTKAYVDCYNEIKEYEIENKIKFDYIFLATGTGTTQAGLVCGQYLNKDFNRKIIGISIARTEEHGKKIVIDSIYEYLNVNKKKFTKLVKFVDDYIGTGYGDSNVNILDIIKNMLFNNGIALNTTYTGKAYYGMMKYIEKNNIENKNILFINTGGLPLFFDNLEEIK